MKLSESQTKTLKTLLSGPTAIPAIHAGKFIDAGYVEKTGESSGQRGYSHVQITAAGRSALAA